MSAHWLDQGPAFADRSERSWQHAVDGDWPVKPTPPLIPGHEGAGIDSGYSVERHVRRICHRFGGLCRTPAGVTRLCRAGADPVRGRHHLQRFEGDRGAAGRMGGDLGYRRPGPRRRPVCELARTLGADVAVNAKSLGAAQGHGGAVRPAPGEFPTPIFDVVPKRTTIRGFIIGTRKNLAEVLAFAAEGNVRAQIFRRGWRTSTASSTTSRRARSTGGWW
jgi:hypothetical protein